MALKCKGIAIVTTLAINLLLPNAAISATEGDIDKLTTYASIMGRAVGCGINTEKEMGKVGAWMDSAFDLESKPMFMLLFMQGVQMNAQTQMSGNSPDSCSDISKSYSKMSWQ